MQGREVNDTEKLSNRSFGFLARIENKLVERMQGLIHSPGSASF